MPELDWCCELDAVRMYKFYSLVGIHDRLICDLGEVDFMMPA